MDNEIFVRSCEVGVRRLAVSGVAAPISIRDQIIRSYTLAQRVPIEWLTQGPVLVVGAGAAGVTFALTAIARVQQHGGKPDVLLVDSEPKPFTRQAVQTRWIDPTQYDWPNPQWILGKMGPPLQLAFKAAEAYKIAARWQAELKSHGVGTPGLAHPLRLMNNAEVEQLQDPILTRVQQAADTARLLGRRLRVLLSDLLPGPARARPNPHRLHTYDGRRVQIKNAKTGQRLVGPFAASLIVYAWGFGQERTCVADCPGPPGSPDPPNHFRSERFWEDDDYESLVANPPVGTPPDDRPIVFISGGEDGALQDLIRIATGRPSVREIFKVLPAPAQTMFADRLSYWCDHESRVWTWGDDAGACVAARNLEDEMVASIQYAYATPGMDPTRELDRLLAATVRALDLRIAHPLGHFDNRYPLNRLIALLLIEHLARRGQQCRMPLVSLNRVYDPRANACVHDPEACRAHPHALELEHMASEPANRCPPYSNLPSWPSQLTAARVVIRHGPRPTPQPWARRVPVRQLPPYRVDT